MINVSLWHFLAQDEEKETVGLYTFFSEEKARVFCEREAIKKEYRGHDCFLVGPVPTGSNLLNPKFPRRKLGLTVSYQEIKPEAQEKAQSLATA